MKPIHTMMRRRAEGKTLTAFYRWARRVGHYPAYEAVQRFWRTP